MDKKGFAAPIGIENYRVNDPFFSRLREVVLKNVIPYQWEALNDRIEGADKSGCIYNFEEAVKCKKGLPHGEHYGCVFQDSDLFKWMEAAAYSLMWAPDSELESNLDRVIELIAEAQLDDGYIDTYYILTDITRRWTNLKDNHELYCAGHMIEAAVAHYRATGKTSFLNVAKKLADHISGVLGPEDGKKHGYPGHEEIELALVKLYEVTGNEKYLELSRHFIFERGRQPLYFEEETKREGNGFYWGDGVLKYAYYQAHKPLMEQNEPVGHAVRANYFYSGAAAAARCAEDEKLYEHLKLLWHEMTEKQMYITGQVGSSEYGEAFTFAYDLPNDTAYAETCAGLALGFFANQMLRIERRGEYADVLERVLYNGAISGMDLDGKAFFYVNPLEVLPQACEKDQRKRHVKPVRQKWFGCACCPPNLARTLSSITDYALSASEDAFYQHLYISGDFSGVLNNTAVKVTLSGDYPRSGELKLTIEPERPVTFTYGLRIPYWCEGEYTLKINGTVCSEKPKNGYVCVTREWKPGDVMELNLPMKIKRVWANENVREDAGRVAVMRGPVVYCLEEADNGKNLHRILLPRSSEFTEEYKPELLCGVTVISCDGTEQRGEEKSLYSFAPPAEEKTRRLTFIPYYAWANRGVGEMTVWLRDAMK